jgi:6-phosphofructokinase 1
MNAAIRSVIRSGNYSGLEMFGVRDGYAGLIAGKMQVMTNRDVGGILQLGGTVLGSARCPEFETVPGREEAIRQLKQRGIDALVVIGGNGSQAGANALNEMGFPVVGVASTIDNDLVGSDITIGVDTALNIALEAIDRLKVTASSHHRAFLIEVMGRKCGYLALMAGIAGGAEAIVVPEFETPPEKVAAQIHQAYERGKPHAIVVVAEGANYEADALMAYFKEHSEKLGFSVRATTLGHVQRGGAPGAYDRILATRLGASAVDYLIKGGSGHLIGMIKGQVTATPYAEVVGRTKSIDPALLELADMLVR